MNMSEGPVCRHVRSSSRYAVAAVLVLLIPLQSGATGAGVNAAEAKVEVRYRHAQFHRLEKAFHSLARGLEASPPKFPQMSRRATEIADLSKELVTWFPKGSGPTSGVDTRAKPKIWSEVGKFHSAAAGFSDRARLLMRAIAAHDAPEARQQFRSVGHACLDCHEEFRRSNWWIW